MSCRCVCVSLCVLVRDFRANREEKEEEEERRKREAYDTADVPRCL